MQIATRARMGAGALMLALGVALGAAAAQPARAEAASTTAPGRITVSGRAEVSAAPDTAVVTLGVTTEAKTAAQAMAGNSRDLDRVFAALKAAGIAARDMQTSGLSLGPRWSRATNGAPPQVVGFTAANNVTVRVRKLDALGGVLDALVRAGANTINGLQFSLSKPGPLQDEARAEAVTDAHRKAALMAEAAGVKLGRVLSISEGGSAPRPLPMLRMAAEAGASPVPVAGGEVSFSADVTVTYALVQ